MAEKQTDVSKGVMIIYDPVFGKPTAHTCCKPFMFHYFDECFGDRKDTPSKSSWIVPGTMPEWAS